LCRPLCSTLFPYTTLFRSVHFCGLSMGGMIGMWLGVHAPERLNKLALCNTGARIGTLETWNARIEAVRKNGMKSVAPAIIERWRSEEHTSELQSRENLVCR